MRDVVVVGGGPAGSMVAAALSKERDVAVVEDHPVSGVPLECTGLVSPEVIEMSGVHPDIYNSFSNLDVHFPDGSVIDFRCGSVKAVLLDRSGFDRLLAERAMDAGAEFIYSEKCTDYSVSSDCVRIGLRSGKDMVARLAVGADGHTSVIRRSVPGSEPRMTVRGIQADVKCEIECQDTIHVWLGSDIAPDFFAWQIPFGDQTRVGLCSGWDSGLPFDYLKAFMKKTGTADCEVVSRNCGKIPLGIPKRTYADRTLLIGDSASQVKPISGGGLYPILKSVDPLVSTAEEAFAMDDFSCRFMSRYQRRWKKSVGKELKNGFTLRNIYNNLRDDELDVIRRKVDTPKVHRAVSQLTIDNPSRLFGTIIRNLPLACGMMPYIVKGLIR